MVYIVYRYVLFNHGTYGTSPIFAVREQNKRSQSLVWVSIQHKGENLYCFLFFDPIIVGLMGSEKRKNNNRGFDFGAETHARLWLRSSCSKPARGSKKHVLFDTALTTAADCSPHRVRVTTAPIGCVGGEFEGRRWSAPGGLAWGVIAWPIYVSIFCCAKQEASSDRKTFVRIQLWRLSYNSVNPEWVTPRNVRKTVLGR